MAMEVNTTDQEEIEQLKKWWSENGTSLVIGVSAGLMLLFGWKAWHNYVDSQGMAASQYFERVQAALIQEDHEKALTVGGQLLDQYSGTIYAANSALGLAAMEVERGNGAAARLHFQWVLENSSFDSPRQLARLGIARTYLNEGDLDQALQQLTLEQSTIYGSHYSEVKGDVLRQQGKREAAQQAYTEAMKLADEMDDRRELLKMKLAEVSS